MASMHLSIGEPFTSPAWGGNFVVFSSSSGEAIPEDLVKDYITKACRYAKHFAVFLVPERMIIMGYHSMCLISPQGKVLGAQKAAFKNLSQRSGKRSNQLDLIQTPYGGVFLCVDVDIYHPEIPRLVQAMGADFIICSQHIQEGDYNTAMVTSGVWGASQGNPMYAVGVSNEFNCVCAPRRLTQNDDGFIVTPKLKMPVTAILAPEQLKRLNQRDFLPRKFYAIHREDLVKG
ncbi:MAG: hypothetical protein FWH00_05125 [Oscillospiraceae bacterium]|nr:hypothetical protein [Oscillospiraceae bacterium]